ncbi:MAG TPA: response regulator [Bradyrhizobium sp.]|uniref:response regulator transcription factor n=1 Tax=Bradyrhizobium sp. CCH5-F6 TaxID=1768753 RepID=UPI000A45F4CC|nr:response regulator [Bradyrhizobium sp. CCH5-F6]HXH42215.1 response regulator [Bradyrhizobium sp.]
MRILLVEDDPLVRELVVEALREEGYDVIHASNGEEALAWCKRRVADVLITDIRLPGQVDGWQIAERCREHDPGLPVIYATGFSPVQPRPVPGSLFLQKPFHPLEIIEALKSLSKQRRSS